MLICTDKEGLTVCGMTLMLATYVSDGKECWSQLSNPANHDVSMTAWYA